MAVFNEDSRVKIPATIQFLRLGYDYQSLKADDIKNRFQHENIHQPFQAGLKDLIGIRCAFHPQHCKTDLQR